MVVGASDDGSVDERLHLRLGAPFGSYVGVGQYFVDGLRPGAGECLKNQPDAV